jgi:hypothetical protein
LAVSVVIVGEETRMQHSEQAGLDPLAERLADGDSRAARDLVERHYTGLFRYAFAMLRGEQEAVEDAVQDAFERALRALGMYPEERIRAMVHAWLYARRIQPEDRHSFPSVGEATAAGFRP